MNRGRLFTLITWLSLSAVGALLLAQQAGENKLAPTTWVHGNPDRFLPLGKLPVDVMSSVPPDRMQELSEKIQAAAVKHQVWFLEQVKKAKPGEPLAYDARLGVTEDEYQEYLKLVENPNPIQKATEASLTVTKIARNRYRIDGGDLLPYLSGIELDFARGVVRTTFGECDKMFVVHASPQQRLTGSFNGYEWTLRTGNLDWIGDAKQATFTSVRFILGRLTQSGRGILYYNARDVVLGELRDASEVMLTFDLGEREPPPTGKPLAPGTELKGGEPSSSEPRKSP